MLALTYIILCCLLGHSSDFIQDNSTVLVEGDILFTAEDWARIEEE